MSDYDLDNMTRRLLGIGTVDEEVRGIVDELDADDDLDDAVEGWLDEQGIGRLLGKHLPTVPRNDVKQVAKTIQGRFNGLQKLYATVTARVMAAQKLRPNSLVSLYATNSGTSCTANTTYELKPRKAGTLQSDNFEFEPDMVFFRLIADPRDCASGFVLVGGTVGWANEKARPFDFDVSLTMLRPEIPIEETPIASMSRRSPKDTTEFQASIRLDAGAATYFYGLHILYYDQECSRNMGAKWSQAIGTSGYTDMVKGLMRNIRPTLSARRRLSSAA